MDAGQISNELWEVTSIGSVREVLRASLSTMTRGKRSENRPRTSWYWWLATSVVVGLVLLGSVAVTGINLLWRNGLIEGESQEISTYIQESTYSVGRAPEIDHVEVRISATEGYDLVSLIVMTAAPLPLSAEYSKFIYDLWIPPGAQLGELAGPDIPTDAAPTFSLSVKSSSWHGARTGWAPMTMLVTRPVGKPNEEMIEGWVAQFRVPNSTTYSRSSLIDSVKRFDLNPQGMNVTRNTPFDESRLIKWVICGSCYVGTAPEATRSKSDSLTVRDEGYLSTVDVNVRTRGVVALFIGALNWITVG